MLRVGDDALARIDVGGVEAAMPESFGDDAAGSRSPSETTMSLVRGVSSPHGGEAAQQFVEPVEFGSDPFGKLCNGFGRDQLRGGVDVAVAQARGDCQRAGAVCRARLRPRRPATGR